MRDTTVNVTARRKKAELITLLCCFIVAFMVNVVSIVIFDTPWSELYTMIGYVAILAIFLYVVWSAIRIVFNLIFKKH